MRLGGKRNGRTMWNMQGEVNVSEGGGEGLWYGMRLY